MAQATSRTAARHKRHARIRLTVEGTAPRPRLAVFRSLNQIYAQVIDDAAGRTIAAASSLEKELRSAKGTKTERAKAVDPAVRARAEAAGAERVAFARA